MSKIGLSVKPKYKQYPEYDELTIIVDIHPNGYKGIVCEHGVLELKLTNGEIIYEAADDWVGNY
jgi:hypothetical protein